MQDGLKRMYGGEHPDPNVMYYLTVYNEPILQPEEPENLDVDGLLRGIYRLSEGPAEGAEGPAARLRGRRAMGPGGAGAAAKDWNVSADVWSVTSWTELRRDGLAADEHNFLNPYEDPHVAAPDPEAADAAGPFVAVTDFMHAVPDQIRQFVPGDFATLGADDFWLLRHRRGRPSLLQGRWPSLVVRTLESLAKRGEIDRLVVGAAIEKYRLLDVTAGTTGTAGGES